MHVIGSETCDPDRKDPLMMSPEVREGRKEGIEGGRNNNCNKLGRRFPARRRGRADSGGCGGYDGGDSRNLTGRKSPSSRPDRSYLLRWQM